MPVIVPNFIALGQTYTRNVIQNLVTHMWTLAPQRTHWPESTFTNLGSDVQQGTMYQHVIFRPVLTTCVRDISRQTSLTSLRARPTDIYSRPKRQVSAKHKTFGWGGHKGLGACLHIPPAAVSKTKGVTDWVSSASCTTRHDTPVVIYSHLWKAVVDVPCRLQRVVQRVAINCYALQLIATLSN